MKRAIVITEVLALLALGVFLSASTGWAKNQDSGIFSTTCLDNDRNLSGGATIAIAPANLWPPQIRWRMTMRAATDVAKRPPNKARTGSPPTSTPALAHGQRKFADGE